MISELKDKKILVIVESPNKVSHIQEYLKKAGYTKVTVVASVGHISNVKDNKKSYKNTGIYPDQDFKMDFAVTDDKKEVVNKLKELAKNSEFIYLMTDGDREGSQISWSLIKFLNLKPNTYRRIVTHEITPKAVVYAFENPIELETNLIEAAQARIAVDKLIGYSLSGVARTYIGAKSVGRTQSAGLKLICDREREILDFKPETYFDIYLNFEKNNTKFKAKYVGTDLQKIDHLKSIAEVNLVKYNCNSNYIIKDIIKKERHEAPKPPFCTATLQQEASNKLGLKVKDIMSICQKLFEGGFITYHRSDSTELSEDFTATLKQYIENTYGAIFTAPRVGKKDENAQDGHEAIRITNLELTPMNCAKAIPNELNQKVYKLIWQRTVAAALPDALISDTIYSIYNNDQKFSLSSSELIDSGYRVVYNYVDEDNKDDNTIIKETFNIDEILNNCMLDPVKKETTPPARYSEAALVKKLQDTGIGRPSTFASIVDTVLSESRGYATLVEKKIVPTERGLQLSAFLDRAFPNIINLNYTKQLEESLDLIAQGKLTKLTLLQAFFTDLEAAIAANTESGPKDANKKICPNCGSDMVIRRSKFGKLFYGCSAYPNCKTIINIE